MHAYPFTPPPVVSYTVNPHFSQQHGPPRAYWAPPPLPADYGPPTLALPEQYYPEGPSSPNPHLQHYTPLPRPASAEPHPQMPYYDASIVSGLPISITHLPLPQSPVSYPPQTFESNPQHNADSEEGKGLRASRISQTLHLSSRHRSVSPLSHRYPMPQSSVQHVSPRSTQHCPIQVPNLPNPYDSQGVLHSPRPIPSPKQSYSGHSPRSENVCTLERMADEVDGRGGDLSADLPKRMASMALNVDKTLPSPPVPSGRQVRPYIEAVFTDAAGPELSPLKSALESAAPHPPTPPLAAITPIKFPRAPTALSGLGANLGRGIPQESGLDALERRLLAEVGTRRQDAGELRPDVRSVVQPIMIPSGGAPAGVNDSAISSLTLADRDAFLRGDEGEQEQEQQPEPEQDRDSDERTQHRGGRHNQSDDEREVRTQRGRGWTKSKHSDEDDEKRAARKRERERKKGKNEMRKLRSETKGRIAAWLGEIDAASPPLMDDSLSTLSPTASHFVPITDNEPFAPVPSSEVPLPSSGDRECGSTSFNDDVSAAPNPRSSGFVTISTLKAIGVQRSPVPAPDNTQDDLDTGMKVPLPESSVPGPILRKMSADQSTVAGPAGALSGAPSAIPKSPGITAVSFIPPSSRHVPSLSPRPARHSPQPQAPEVKYDIRSARGGRGGKVMEVASLWAAKADGAETQAKPNRVAPPVKRPVNYGGRLPIKSPLSSQNNGLVDTSKEGRGKATKTTKATTVPAIVSSSHAVPMLSSTASLARSPPNPRTPTSIPLPPMISETMSNGNIVKAAIPKTTRPPSDLGFGQARLRDLIKKYQG